MNNQEEMVREANKYYPNHCEIDRWAAELFRRAETIDVFGEPMNYCPSSIQFGNFPNALENRYIKFNTTGVQRNFWGYWQPAICNPAPLLINLPGYGSSISMYPQLADQGFHILHISPMGYVEPTAVHTELKLADGNWPVLDYTARGASGGYTEWLTECLLAIRWAMKQPGVLPRVSIFGTSQGGGGALLLASILGDEVRCVCADLPFLTDFKENLFSGSAYGVLKTAYAEVNHQLFWNRLGYVDTLSHVHRIHVPVMLSAGGKDEICPAKSVEKLFANLNCTKQYTFLENAAHTLTRESVILFAGWLRLYA